MIRPWLDQIKRLTKAIYLKLFRINDTPAKIAFGFGIGAFVGVMPGVGPLAALLLAFVFRVNRASALLASLVLNTWAGFVALLLFIKVGAIVMGRDPQDVHAAWTGIFKEFKWEKLFEVSVYDVLLPIGVGYLVVSLLFAVVAGSVVYAAVVYVRKKKRD